MYLSLILLATVSVTNCQNCQLDQTPEKVGYSDISTTSSTFPARESSFAHCTTIVQIGQFRTSLSPIPPQF